MKNPFLKCKEEELEEHLERVNLKMDELSRHLHSLRSLEMDLSYEDVLIRYALGRKKSKRCKLYKSLSRTKAKCLFYNVPLKKEVLFKAYCSICSCLLYTSDAADDREV